MKQSQFEQSDLQQKQQISRNPLIGVLCINQKNAVLSCLDDQCLQYAFLCQDKSCLCKKTHQHCLKVQADKLIQKIERKLISYDSLIECIEIGFQKVIEQISNYRDKIINQIKTQMKFAGLNYDQRLLLTLIDEKNFKDITGSLIWKAHLHPQPNLSISSQITKSIDMMNKVFEKIEKQLEQKNFQLEQIIQAQIKFNQKQSDQNQKSKFSARLIHEMKHFSQIIKNNDQINTLQQFFNPKQIKNVYLLYRASQNNFEVDKFHEKCDNIPQTLTLCMTQFGKVIGGYTPLVWKSQKNSFVMDLKFETFIFSLTNKEKFNLIDQTTAIHYSKGYGPSFGYGSDFAILDNSNISDESHTLVPSSYAHPNYVDQNKQSYERFCGNPIEHHFKTKEWEVWKIQFQEQKQEFINQVVNLQEKV